MTIFEWIQYLSPHDPLPGLQIILNILSNIWCDLFSSYSNFKYQFIGKYLSFKRKKKLVQQWHFVSIFNRFYGQKLIDSHCLEIIMCK